MARAKKPTRSTQSDAPHVAAALAYAEGVAAGRILACKFVRQACRRHLDDLERQQQPEWPYRFDSAKAERICRFAENLPHIKGRWAIRRPGDAASFLIRLEPWQCFILVCIFGWLNKATGLRRFRRCYAEIPRKNGKSMLGAVIGLYMLTADGEHGAEVYSGATSEKQAWEVFRPAKLMVEQTEALRAAFGVAATASNINVAATASRFEPIIGKPGDGSSPSCSIVDEFHEHLTDDLVDTMLTGMGAREQPLLLVITTAGTDTAGPCYALRDEAIKVLDGTVVDDGLFAAIYTVDEDDDWTSEAALRKANPNFDISVGADFLRARQTEAIQSSRKQNVFKTKHLNVWCSARTPYFNMEAWAKLADARIDQFQGDECTAALDLGSKVDLTAYVKCFKRSIDGADHFFLFGRFYLPETTAEDPDKRHYAGWAHDGHLTVTDGNVVDYGVIEEDVFADAERFAIARLGFDPWNATATSVRLAEGRREDGDGRRIEVVEIPQTVAQLSEPMKWLDGLILAGRVHHDGNPVLTWCLSNVTAKEDAKGNVFPRKERREQKIDGAVAAIMALGLAMDDNNSNRSIYEDRTRRPNGFLVL